MISDNVWATRKNILRPFSRCSSVKPSIFRRGQISFQKELTLLNMDIFVQWDPSQQYLHGDRTMWKEMVGKWYLRDPNFFDLGHQCLGKEVKTILAFFGQWQAKWSEVSLATEIIFYTELIIFYTQLVWVLYVRT